MFVDSTFICLLFEFLLGLLLRVVIFSVGMATRSLIIYNIFNIGYDMSFFISNVYF